jgi:hypothetical protein
MRVHTVLGPGLPESAYEACLPTNLQKLGFSWNGRRGYPSFMAIWLAYSSLKPDEAISKRRAWLFVSI